MTTKQSLLSTNQKTWGKVDLQKANVWKKDGNDLFKRKTYNEAIGLYSKALEASGETVRAILSNWAFCALQVRNFGDVLAATVASLRIGYNDKAYFRFIQALSFLGDYDLAQQAYHQLRLPQSIVKISTMKELFTDLAHQIDKCVQLQQAMGENDNRIQVISQFIVDTPTCIGNWIHGSLETYRTRDKGRGIRAMQDIPEGSIVLIEWPLVSESYDLNTKKDLLISCSSNSTFNLYSSAELRRMVVNRLKREATLAKILSHMSDGDHTPSLVPISDLLINLEIFPVLLPTHHEYKTFDNCHDPKGHTKNGINEITADRVHKILNINCHGTHETLENDKTQLYPTVSMMNHASKPNCTLMETNLKILSVVRTCKHVKSGEELTMKYNSDEVVEKNGASKQHKLVESKLFIQNGCLVAAIWFFCIGI